MPVGAGPGYSGPMDSATATARTSRSTIALDVGIAGLIILVGLLTMGSGRRSEVPAILVTALPLAIRRFWPFPILALVATMAVATSLHTETPWIQIVSVALAAFTTGESAGDRAWSVLGTIAVAALMTFGFLVQDVDPFQAAVLPFAIVLPAWLVGDVVRTTRLEAADRARAAERALRDAEERARSAAAEERRHMARELHDVVAHGVSVMVIQAGAARQVVDTAPDRAAEALLTVEATGREVMAELRRLLGVLNDAGEAAGLSPQPGIEQLGALVDRVRAAGLPAELEIVGSPRALPASLDATAYRIVQEALTNALRYARRAATLVHVSFDAEQLRLEVLDDGPAGEAEAGEGSGRGLVGMRQRAALVGGRLEAGPRLGGGYAVRAWLPLEQVPAEPEPS
jgi:signal transduction histidine kinase